MSKIKTSSIAGFINTTPGTLTANWARIRKQSELNLSYDAETQEDNWVDEDTPSTSLEKYAVSIAGELTAYNDDALFTFLDELRQNRATGTDAETECLVIYKYDQVSSGFKAEKNKCTIQFSEFGGEGGGGSATLNYTVNFNGDPVLGTASIDAETGAITFTPNS